MCVGIGAAVAATTLTATLVCGAIASGAVIAGVATGVVLGGVMGDKTVKNAKAQRDKQEEYQEKSLKLKKADKARQAIVERNQLRMTRAKVMTSVSLNELMTDRASREASNLRRENALSGAGTDVNSTSRPAKNYNYGKTTH